jgi:DNA-binding CsgD family transcriptional regulator
MTERAAQVCRMFFEGASTERVAELISASPDEVRELLQQLCDKTGARSQAELLRNLALSAAVE